MVKVLYHYTSSYHLPKIIENGYLKLTESNLRIDDSYDIIEYNQGTVKLFKPVVWLTDSDDSNNLGLNGGITDKTEIKITVKMLPYFKKWVDWSKKNNMDKSTAKALKTGLNYKSWWISENIIKMNNFIKIENIKTGEIYFENLKYAIKEEAK